MSDNYHGLILPYNKKIMNSTKINKKFIRGTQLSGFTINDQYYYDYKVGNILKKLNLPVEIIKLIILFTTRDICLTFNIKKQTINKLKKISNFTNIGRLILSNFKFNTIEPLTKLKHLEVLQLNGKIPYAFNMRNSFPEKNFNLIQNLKSLKKLRIVNFDCYIISEETEEKTTYKYIQSNIYSVIGKLTNLLNLQLDTFGNTNLLFINNLKKIKHLEIYYRPNPTINKQFGNTGPEFNCKNISNLTELRHFETQGMNIENLNMFKDKKYLENLSIIKNCTSQGGISTCLSIDGKFIIPSLEPLHCLTNLKKIDLYGLWLNYTKKETEYLLNLSKLKQATLSNQRGTFLKIYSTLNSKDLIIYFKNKKWDNIASFKEKILQEDTYPSIYDFASYFD